MLSLGISLQLLAIGLMCVFLLYFLLANSLINGLIAVHDKRLQQVYNLLRSKNANDVKAKKSNSPDGISKIIDLIPPEVIGGIAKNILTPKGSETVVNLDKKK